MVDFDRHAEERYNAFEATGGPAHGGITVLDWFAGKAMTALVKTDLEQAYETGTSVSVSDVSAKAYYLAEAMLKERAKRHAPKGAVQGVTGKFYG